jgi:DNA-directed RNA polymerase subunit F
MFSRLTSYFPWLITICALVVSFFYVAEQQFLESKVAVLQSDNARVVVERNSVIEVNHAMHNTIQQMQQQIDEARDADNWLREVSKIVDAKLNTVVDDIKRLTNEDEAKAGCVVEFSPDVYQRMLDAYRDARGGNKNGSDKTVSP